QYGSRSVGRHRHGRSKAGSAQNEEVQEVEEGLEKQGQSWLQVVFHGSNSASPVFSKSSRKLRDMRDERTLRPKRLRPCECCRRATRTGESALAFVLDDRGQLHGKYEEHKRQASPMFKSAECRSQSRVWHSRPFD